MIDQIAIKSAGVEYKFSLEQAQEVYENLKQIFDKEKEVVTVPSPYPVYPTPDPYKDKWPYIIPTVWCSTSSTKEDVK